MTDAAGRRERNLLAVYKYRALHPEAFRASRAKFRTAHREEIRAADRITKWKWREKNRELHRERARKWAKENAAEQAGKVNRRRASRLGASGSHTVAEWLALCAASSWLCAYCGRVLTKGTAHRDHLTPLSRGGSDDISNIAVSCRPCNSSKGTRTVPEFFLYLSTRRSAALTERESLLNSEQKAAILAAVSAALDGVTVPPPPPTVPWYRDTSSPVPTVPLADVTDVASIKRYAAHGFRTNLRRGVAPENFPTYLAIADRLAAVPDTAPSTAADAILPGTGNFDKDVAILLVLGGAVQGLGPFQTASLNSPWGAPFDMVEAAAYLSRTPGQDDAGVSGR